MKTRDEFVIYKITNIINNKIYIGSAKYFARRKGEHYYMWRNSKHSNQHLQNSYNKYGDVFKFEIIEYCIEKNLIEKEQFYIDTLNPQYNILKEAYSSIGFKHSEETKQLLSKKFKGMQRSLGRKFSEETKSKMRESALKRHAEKRFELQRLKENNK
jgi:group I intron endonuclease